MVIAINICASADIMYLRERKEKEVKLKGRLTVIKARIASLLLWNRCRYFHRQFPVDHE